MSTPDIERPDIVEQARAALSDWHEACARMDEVDADPDLEHEDRRHAQDIVTEAALETAWLMADLVAEADRLRGQLDRARDFAARLEADGARLVERIEGMIVPQGIVDAVDAYVRRELRRLVEQAYAMGYDAGHSVGAQEVRAMRDFDQMRATATDCGEG